MLNKYSKDSGPIDEIIHQIKMIRNPNKTPLKTTIAERVKLRRQKAETLKRQRLEKLRRQREERQKNQKIRSAIKILTQNKVLTRLPAVLS